MYTFWRESEALVFWGDFKIIISHIIPENFIEISQVLQKIWRFFPSTWWKFTISINFFNLLETGFLTIVFSYIDKRLVLLEIWSEERGSNWSPSPKKNTLKKWSLVRVLRWLHFWRISNDPFSNLFTSVENILKHLIKLFWLFIRSVTGVFWPWVPLNVKYLLKHDTHRLKDGTYFTIFRRLQQVSSRIQ